MQLRQLLILYAILKLSFIFAPDATAQEAPPKFKVLTSQQAKETQALANDWLLTGTIGQWNATAPRALSNGVNTISGGAWSVNVRPRPKNIFNDRFEAQNIDNE